MPDVTDRILRYLEYKLKDSRSGTDYLQRWTEEIYNDVKTLIESERK